MSFRFRESYIHIHTVRRDKERERLLDEMGTRVGKMSKIRRKEK